MKNHRLHPEAEEDAKESVRFYRKRSRRAGKGFSRELGETITLARRFPEMGTPHAKSPGMRGLRLNSYPHTVHYKIHEDEIQIYAVAHHSRRPDYWLDRVDDDF